MVKGIKIIKYFIYYLVGNTIFRYKYDKKYLTSRWFYSKWHGIGAQGWEWVLKEISLGKLRQGRKVVWPSSPLCTIVGEGNIYFDPDDLNNFQSPGCYFQCAGDIILGRGTYIGPNVGIITSNHDISDLNKHLAPQNVVIGENCWIGMNSVILPGVRLGNRTIVGAGSIVTKSFLEGNCIIAGNPAKIIKKWV